MGNPLRLSKITALGCLLAMACAPLDEDNDTLTNEDYLDAGADAQVIDATVGGDGDDATGDADVPPYDDDPVDSGTPDAAPPVQPPVVPPITPPVTPPVTPDAGTAKPDAGTPDAGTPKPDAGTPDAGTPKPDAGTPDAGTPDAGTPDAGTPLTTKFTHVYAIISEKCAFCHVADHIGLQLGHLDMSDQATAHRNLVNQPAQGIDCGGTEHVRVKPGDPEKSLIIHKLMGTADCGVRMPDGFPALSKEQIEVFRNWIKAGAKND